ncbi:MAG: GyrI-like domain-containing protein [Fimbriimonadaceae bacterium]
MNVQIVELAPIRVVMMRHRGPYDQLGPIFEKLAGWVTTNGVSANRWIGIYWDNPEETPADQLRSAACVEVPLTYQLNDTGGLALDRHEIVGGKYATTRFVGPYEALERVWTEFTAQVEGQLGQEITQNPAFEVYVNDPSDTPANQLITELYMPVR